MSETLVHIFSKFTPEALLFEALVIFVLCGGYAAFWILKKRRMGSSENQIPAPVVKSYLNELILDAEKLRAQLFGLLGHPQPNLANIGQLAHLQAATPGVSMDAALVQKIAELEGRLGEQTKTVEAIVIEKTKLQKELEMAKANMAAGGATGAPAGDSADLLSRIQVLEGKLAEYSIIEDDLANLKRLQQENAQLKAALAAAGKTAPAAAAPAPAPVAAAPAPEPAKPAPAPEPVKAAPAPEPAPEPEPAPAPAAAAPPPAAAEPAAQSDADLVEEFEKMLNA